MFRNRKDAGHRLAAQFRGRSLQDPLVLAIPRGGVVVGAVLAHELGAELDVVLSRKLRAPCQPELAIGAIAEDGTVYMDETPPGLLEEWQEYVIEERAFQSAEIARRRRLFRMGRPPASVVGRSVIVTDDGIATGSTMIAALKSVKVQNPRELIVAVPVAPPLCLYDIKAWCDEAVCLLTPKHFWAVGQFYEEFNQVADAEVIAVLERERARSASASLS